jgi:inosine-uridine nucleoside N-ribohydrolase
MDENLKAGAEKSVLQNLDTGKLIIDTDAGVDDAVALFLALGYEKTQVKSTVRITAITCVFGNTNANNVAANVLKVLKTANRMDVSKILGSHGCKYEDGCLVGC